MKSAPRKRPLSLLLAGWALLLPLLLLVPGHAQTSREDSKQRAAQQEARSVQVTLAAAQEALEREEYNLAATQLENLLFRHPGHREALLNLAYCYSRMERTADAVDLYRQTLEREPKLFPARLNLALLLAQEEKFAKAAAEFKRALELKPDHYQARFSYAFALERSGDKEEALEQYLRAAQLDASAVEPRRAALWMLVEKKDWTQAQELLAALQRLEPTNHDWLLTRAEVLTNQNKSEEALAVYERYFQAADPSGAPSTLGELHMRAGSLYRELGKQEDALRHFAAAVETGGESYELASVTAQAHILASLKRYSEALPHYRRAVELQPESAELRAGRGHALLQNRNFREAARELLRALELDPQRIESYNHLASAFHLSEKPQGAVEVLAQRARLAPETPGTLFLRAVSHDQLGQCIAAMEYYQKFLDTKPDGQSNEFFQAAGRLRTLKKTCREQRRRVK